MPILSRRACLAAGIVLAGVAASLTAPAQAADKIVLRFSTAASDTDIRFAAFKIFADAVKDFATFEPHYNATLFTQSTELPAIQRGNLELAMPNPSEIAKQVPAWSIFSAGYLIRDPDHLMSVFKGEVGKEFYKMAEDALGIKVLGVMYSGTRQVNLRGNKKINTPADMSGVNLRMPGTEGWQFLGAALGANPTPLSFTEVYTSLKTGAIDGQDNALFIDKDSKFYEVTNQIVLTSHYTGCDFLVMSGKVWNEFTPEQQTIVQKAATATLDEIKRIVVDAEVDLVAFMKSEGLDVYTPDVDAFRIHVQKVYLESAYAKDWPAGMLDRINAVK